MLGVYFNEKNYSVINYEPLQCTYIGYRYFKVQITIIKILILSNIYLSLFQAYSHKKKLGNLS
jgi:hypothetical protein